MKKIVFCIILIVNMCTAMQAQMLSTTATGLTSYPRAIHQSQVLSNGKVLVFGGNNFDYLNLVTHNSSELYNPQTNTWTVAAAMNHARVYFASVVLNNGDVMAIGGPDASCEVYNVQNNTWTDVASMNSARNHHMALKLNNGMVLVAGPDNTCELYNSATNTWSFTGNMNLSRGDGMTLTLLNDGKVLAMGGENSKKTAEIYDPKTGIWKLISSSSAYDRYDHSSVLLANGNVLLIGSGNTTYGTTCELFNPATETFSSAGSLSEIHMSDPAILLDDNRVLIFDIGDIFTPTDTKIFEVYNPTTNTWSHDKYVSVGATLYSINKLDNGKVLIAGGTFTTGNGAINGGLTVSVNSLSNSITKTYSVNVDNSSPCYGKDVKLTLSSSQSGVSYTAYNNTNIVSNTVVGGGAISLTIPYDKLTPGKNLIKIKCSKSGSYSEYLTQVITINTSIQNNAIPILSVGDTAICQGSSITINATSVSSILWSDYTTGPNLTTNKASIYYAQSRDANGCLSLPSNNAVISFLPSAATINAGADFSTCTFNNVIDLGGVPSGGYWTGAGVENKHFFNPAVTDTGTFVVQYNYCTASDAKQIKVKRSPNVPDFSMSILNTTICNKAAANSISISNANPGVKYALYKNNTLIQTYTNNTTFKYTIPTNSITATSVFSVKAYYPECSVDTLIKKDTLVVMPYPNVTLTSKFVRDTVCIGEPHIIYILNPQKDISYVAYYPNFAILSDTVLCDRTMDTLFITVKPVEWNPSVIYIYAINALGCKTTLNGALYPKTVSVGVDFNLNYDSQTVNDTLVATNISNSTSYVWSYTPGINSLVEGVNQFKFSSSVVGSYSVTLTGTSRYGCIKSRTKNVNFFNKNNAEADINICRAKALVDANNNKINPENIITHHVDKDGFAYVSYYKRYYETDINMYISKIAPDGSVVWSIQQTDGLTGNAIYDYFAAYCNGIDTDDNGNVYVTGSFRAYQMKFNDIVVGKCSSIYTRFYCMKFDANGKIIWWVASEDNGKNAGTDIKYVDEDNIYLSVMLQGSKTRFRNGLFNLNGDGGVRLIKINSKGEFVEQFTTTVGNYSKLFTWFVPPYAYYYGAHETVLGPKLNVSNNSIHMLGRCKPGYSINNKAILSDSTIIYYDHTLDLNTKTWKDPVKVFETTFNQGTPLQYQFDSINNQYYIISNNTINKIDSLGTRIWTYKFHPSLKVLHFVLNDDTIFVQGSYKDYFIIPNNSSLDGINTGNKENVFLAKLDVNGNFIGLDHFGSTGKDIPSALLKTSKNEIISIGLTENDIMYNDSLISKAGVDGYYVRGKMKGSCTTSDYNQLKILSPEDKSIYCSSTTVPIKWYYLQSDSLHVYYRKASSSQYTKIMETLAPSKRLYNWNVPTDLLGDSVYFKITNGSNLSDSIMLRVLPLVTEKVIIDTLLCKGSPVSYDFANQYETYTWKSGGTESARTFISPVMDTVIVSNAIGCKGMRYFNVRERKHKLTINCVNSSMQSVTGNVSLYKIVNNLPVNVMNSNFKTQHVLSVDTGSYYIRTNQTGVPTYYVSDYSSVLFMTEATKLNLTQCYDSTVISIVQRLPDNYNYTSYFTGKYVNGSCTGAGIPNVNVYLVSNSGKLLQSSTTNSYGQFSFTQFSSYGSDNIYFDDYPINAKKFPIVPSQIARVFYRSNNLIYDCSLITNVETENFDRFKCVSPVTEELTVNFSSSKDRVIIKLLNIQGALVKEVFNGKIEKNKEYTLKNSIQELPAGVYICTYDDGENSYSAKIIVTR